MNQPFKVGDLVRLVQPCIAVEGEHYIGGRIVEVWPWFEGNRMVPRYGVALRNVTGHDGGEEFIQFVKAEEIRPAHN